MEENKEYKVMATPGDYEHTYEWANMSREQCYLVIASHVAAFGKAGKKVSQNRMERIFELGKPKCVIGMNEGKPIIRIHADSVAVMKIIMVQYLDSK